MAEDGDPPRANANASADPAIERAGLCLAFANTLLWHASESPRETLHGYAELLAWAQANRALSAAQAEALARRARRDAAAGAAVHARAIALREAIYRVFVDRRRGRAPAAEDTALLNDELQRALPHYRIELDAEGAHWQLASGADALEAPLWPLVHSAAELLLSGALAGRVGQCADAGGCGWLFLDLSKNRSRRWCSIADCGNRAKQRRMQARRKAAR